MDNIYQIEKEKIKVTAEGFYVIRDKEELKSDICIEDIHVYTKYRFNWLQKKMIKFLLGFDVKDL